MNTLILKWLGPISIDTMDFSNLGTIPIDWQLELDCCAIGYSNLPRPHGESPNPIVNGLHNGYSRAAAIVSQSYLYNENTYWHNDSRIGVENLCFS